MDDWSARFPTCTTDVAAVISQLITRRFEVDGTFCGTYHFSSKEVRAPGQPYTKFTISQVGVTEWSASASLTLVLT